MVFICSLIIILLYEFWSATQMGIDISPSLCVGVADLIWLDSDGVATA